MSVRDLDMTKRCICCDLPSYSCGRAAINRARGDDPKWAAWLETPEGARP